MDRPKLALTPERVLQAQFHDHHQRRELASGAQVLHRGAGRRQHHVGGRLSVPGNARGSAFHERCADLGRRQGEDLPSQRRARVPHPRCFWLSDLRPPGGCPLPWPDTNVTTCDRKHCRSRCTTAAYPRTIKSERAQGEEATRQTRIEISCQDARVICRPCACVAIVVLFFVGLLLRQRRILSRRARRTTADDRRVDRTAHADSCGVSRLPLHAQLFWLPATAMLAILVGCAVSAFAGRRLELDAKAFGAFVTCSTALNISLEYPFMLAIRGANGFAELALFDLGNALMLCTFGYLLAAKLGRRTGTWWQALQRLGSFPPLWALLLALIINFFSLPVSTCGARYAAGDWWLGSDARTARARHPVRRSPCAFQAVADCGGSTPRCRAGNGDRLCDAAGSARADAHRGARRQLPRRSASPLWCWHSAKSLDAELAASATSLSVLLGLLYIPLALLWLE